MEGRRGGAAGKTSAEVSKRSVRVSTAFEPSYGGENTTSRPHPALRAPDHRSARLFRTDIDLRRSGSGSPATWRNDPRVSRSGADRVTMTCSHSIETSPKLILTAGPAHDPKENRRDRDARHRSPSRGARQRSGGHRERDREQRAQPARGPQRAHPRPGLVHAGHLRRRPGADPAVHAEARGPLPGRRVRRAGEAVAPARALPHPAWRHRGGGRARRHGQRRLRRDDDDLLQAARGCRRGRGRLHPRPRQGA